MAMHDQQCPRTMRVVLRQADRQLLLQLFVDICRFSVSPTLSNSPVLNPTNPLKNELGRAHHK